MAINNGVYVEKADQSGAVPALPVIPAPSQVGGGGPTSLFKQKFFSNLSLGKQYREGAFQVATPAWAAGILVNDGYMCQNAGNLYVVIRQANQTGTTTTAGSAPTHTNNLAVAGADGIYYLYCGAATNPLSDSQDAPVVTIGTTPASCTRRYDPQNAADFQAFTITGGNYINASGPGGAFNGLSPATQFDCNFTAAFYTDAPILQFNKVQNAGGASTTGYAIEVNDVPLYCKHTWSVPYLVNSNNNNLGVTLDFTTKPNRTRKIVIKNVGRFNAKTFTGIWIPPTNTIYPINDRNSWRLYVEGDSTAQGANPSNGLPSLSGRLGALLGTIDVWDSSQGGTGFINSGGGSTLFTRLPKVIAAAPDLLYVAPINNDVGNDATFNSSSRRAAYTSYFGQVLAKLPNVIIIAGGGFGNGASNLTTGIGSPMEVEADMLAAITAINNPRLKFLPTLSDPAGRWLYGDGSASTATNSVHGNSDYFLGDGSDTLHPNLRWLDAMPVRVANGIVTIMNGY